MKDKPSNFAEFRPLLPLPIAFDQLVVSEDGRSITFRQTGRDVCVITAPINLPAGNSWSIEGVGILKLKP